MAPTHTVLITGASGLLGRALLKEFSASPNWKTIGTAYSRCGENLRKIDLRNKSEIEALISEVQPDVVVHSAAERRPDVVEKEQAATKSLNVDATHCIAENVANSNGYMLYISTDYVFDGSSPPYTVQDTPNPLNKYGESKLAGEIETLKYKQCGGVLRVPVLYGCVEHLHESVVTGLYDTLIRGARQEVSDYEQRCPTLVDDVAVVCRQMAEGHVAGTSFRGIWHFGSDCQFTKYGMIQEMADIFDCKMDHVIAISKPSEGARRPYNCKFDCSSLLDRGIGKVTPFRDGVKYCVDNYHKRFHIN